jgi:hypothetical protein
VDLPSDDELLAIYDGMRGGRLGQAQSRLFECYGLERLIPLLVQIYPKIRRSQGRIAILFWLPSYARQRDDVVALALSALDDHAYLVRSNACGILAYSLRDDAVLALGTLLTHKHLETRADAAAAIDAINAKNHHYFVDAISCDLVTCFPVASHYLGRPRFSGAEAHLPPVRVWLPGVPVLATVLTALLAPDSSCTWVALAAWVVLVVLRRILSSVACLPCALAAATQVSQKVGTLRVRFRPTADLSGWPEWATTAR